MQLVVIGQPTTFTCRQPEVTSIRAGGQPGFLVHTTYLGCTAGILMQVSNILPCSSNHVDSQAAWSRVTAISSSFTGEATPFKSTTDSRLLLAALCYCWQHGEALIIVLRFRP